MKTGITTSVIINIGKKRRQWHNKGKAHCKRCEYLQFGYYCAKKRRSAEWVNKPKQCTDYKQKQMKSNKEI